MSYRSKGATLLITEDLVHRATSVLSEHGCPDELVVRDRDLKGFVLRLRATGRHTFGFAYGRAKLLTLGSADGLTAGRARKKARDARAETDLNGAPLRVQQKAAKATLGEFIEDPYGSWAKEHLKSADSTLARLRTIFADLLPTRMADLSAFTVERWRTKRLKDGKVRSTVNRDLDDLRAAFNRAVLWGFLKVNPIASIKRYRLDSKGVVRYLTIDEELRLLAALQGRDARRRQARESANRWRQERGYDQLPAIAEYSDHLTPLVIIALHTGLRRGELFDLRWQDVDLASGMIVVRGETAKSGQTRHVPMNAVALAALKTWAASNSAEASGFIFPAADGSRLDNVTTSWTSVVTDGELKAFRFHDLRHTFASKLVMAGVDLNTVRELLGHADIKMTLRYAHLAPEMKAAAVAKLVAGGA